MKKILTILILCFSVLFSACSGKENDFVRDESKLQVYTSFYAVCDFVQKIGGDKIQVYNLVPSGTEPHNWEPTSGDMLNLENADFLFYNGGGMEGWIDKVRASIENENIEYVELSKDVDFIKSEHTHEHEEGENHDEEGVDPHIWLDPQNAKKEAFAIKEALSAKDAENADYYSQKYDEFAKKADELDESFKEVVSGAENKTIVVAHQAYGYLCKAYGLEQLAIEGLSADSEPSPAKMAEISKTVKEKGIKYIFFEELLTPKAASVIAEETGTELLVLNPFEGLTDEEIANGGDYFSVMYKNLENIEKALGR